MALDGISLEIIGTRLREIGSTMEHLLFHSGYSTILRESRDGSASITDRDGCSVETTGAPINLLPYKITVQSVLKRYPLDTIADGDCFISNDPYDGGTLHVPDVIIVTPIFVEGEIIGFCCSSAHKPDMGGLVPGSSGAGAREIFHEGLMLPGVKYWTKEGVNAEVEAIIRRNCRIPEIIAGDLRAQVGCTLMGVQHVRKLCEEYGKDVIKQAFSDLLGRSERRLRERLSAWPDGEFEAETFVDHDGVDLNTKLRLHVKVRKTADEIIFDYSGTNDQVKGPTNLRPQSSQVAAVLALIVTTDPTIQINDGVLRPIKFINPEGKITNPAWPAPVNSYFGLANVLYSTVGRALANFDPDRAVASAGLGLGAIAIGYDKGRSGRKAVQYDLFTTAQGGTSNHDGSSGTVGFLNSTPSTPIEVIETEFPVHIARFEWVTDSAGAGRFRGGLGNRKEYELVNDATVTIRLGHQFDFAGWGVFGGEGPRPMRVVLNPGKPEERLLHPLQTLQLKAGDRFMVEMAGGGGYGDPFTRDAERVRLDVENGYVSAKAAERHYGVVLDTTLAIDQERTRGLRARNKSATGSRAATRAPDATASLAQTE
jgi:N-methylhydantoinase B